MVILPPKDLLRSFSDFVRPALTLIVNANKTIANLAVQRNLLLPRLISGELSVAAAEAQLEVVA
jgi:type I restriction enzyme S subunit